MNKDTDKEIDFLDPELYELYGLSCDRRGLIPSIHNYMIWLEQNYEQYKDEAGVK